MVRPPTRYGAFDAVKGASRGFSVNLANAAGNAVIADGHAVGTIVNDDQARAKRAHAHPLRRTFDVHSGKKQSAKMRRR